jgi:aspartyl-tRNA(Asn)/glutamyl-tRNA(Gln) amidotransferase subunit A
MKQSMELHNLSIREAQDLLSSKQVSSLELTAAALDYIHRNDQQINAFVTVADELALEQARRADERLRSGVNNPPLTGIPFAVKDCISTKGVRTTCSSRILENYVPQYNATVIDRLSEAGAVLLGKHNMDEFGMGSSCENSAFFNTHNPWDLERVPGGSSGGSAAAVASGMGYFALGEDTGGSIRMPAGFCNVTGLKTTYGRVSRYGLIALVSSFDSIGPMARSAWDCAAVLQTIAGQDLRDATSLPAPVPDYLEKLDRTVKDLRLGIPKEY